MKARIIKTKALSFAAAAAMVLGGSSFGAVLEASAYDSQYDNSFTFTDTGITAENESGSGYKIDGTDLTINEAGVYVVSGDCMEGTIKIKKGTEGVTLVLSDLKLSSSSTSPISVNKTSQVTFVIEGENVITDNEDPANEDSEDADIADAFEGAAIKVKSGASAVFTGTGTLTADGSDCKNGIKGGSEADITVGTSESDSFTLNVSAANNALASDGTLTINGGTINVESADDGIKASPDDDDEVSLGLLVINGGAVNVTAADDAIHGENVYINGGVLTISAGDDAIKAEYELNIGTEDGGPEINITESYEGLEGATVNLWGGNGTIITSDDGINAANSDLTDYAYELNIYGGSWYINAGGDGLDSNGDINVSGGYTEVYGSTNGDNAALDYGDFGSSFNVTGGTVIGIGMAQMATTPTSGTYIVFGAGGMAQGGQFGEQGERPEMPEGEEGQSPENGEQGEPPAMPDGEQGQPGEQGEQGERPEMPEGTEGQPFDNDGQGGMMPGQQDGSAINISAGDEIEIRDSANNVLFSSTAPKNADHIVYASDLLTEGEVYYLFINGTLAAASDGSQVAEAVPAAADTVAEESEQTTEESESETSSEETESEESSETESSESGSETADDEDTGSTAESTAAQTTASGSVSSASQTNPSTGKEAAGLGLGALAAALFAVITKTRR